jgi:HlyD family secretion protein
MKRKSIVALALVALLVVLGGLGWRAKGARDSTTFKFATVEKGDLRASVSATGTLSAVTTVNVGTQVSGQVSELNVDFNDKVKKGQLLARIDPTLAQAAVTDAQANLEKARAQALQAQREFNRNRELLNSGLVARSEFESTQSSSAVARASVTSAQVALDRARQNLSYTNIYAPIDGVVVDRKIDKGQTVAASLSAPELFSIANDLRHMQILTQVSESDIAQIKQGQPVEFTVQALQGEKFNGVVQQVRLQSTTQDNVVNYTVVVAVDNAQEKLLPGMTARVDFVTKSAEDVLKVSNAALRFKPSEEMLKKYGDPSKKGREGSNSAATSTMSEADRQARRAQWQQRNGGAAGGSGSGRRSGSMGQLYVLDADGKLQIVRVRTGVSDATFTEVRGRDLKEGMKVIVGVNQPKDDAKTAAASPFQGTQQQRGGGPGGGRGGF